MEGEQLAAAVTAGSPPLAKPLALAASPESRGASTDGDDMLEEMQLDGASGPDSETKLKEEDGAGGKRGFGAAVVSAGAAGGSHSDSEHETKNDETPSLSDGSDIDEADIEEALRHLDVKDRKIIALMAELEEERERRKKMNHDVFRIKERVGKDIAALEETIAEQEATNERLKATLVLRQEEADIMTQILKVRDKELSAAHKQAQQVQFQVECLQGDVQELKLQLAKRDQVIQELTSGVAQGVTPAAVASLDTSTLVAEAEEDEDEDEDEDDSNGSGKARNQPAPSEVTKLQSTMRIMEAEILCYQRKLLELQGVSVPDQLLGKRVVGGDTVMNPSRPLTPPPAPGPVVINVLSAATQTSTPQRSPEMLRSDGISQTSPAKQPSVALTAAPVFATAISPCTPSQLSRTDAASDDFVARFKAMYTHLQLLCEQATLYSSIELLADRDASFEQDDSAILGASDDVDESSSSGHAGSASVRLREEFTAPRVQREDTRTLAAWHGETSTCALQDWDPAPAASAVDVAHSFEPALTQAVKAAVEAMALLKARLQHVTQERDEYCDSLTQAGEFGQFLLLENETLKRQAAEMQCTLSLTARTPTRVTGTGATPLRAPYDSPHLLPQFASPAKHGWASPSPASPASTASAQALRLKSPSNLVGVDEAVLAQLSQYKRTAEDAMRKNTSLEREHKRLMDTLRTMDEELVLGRQRLEDYQSKYEDLDKRVETMSSDLSRARVDAMDARAECSALQQELESTRHTVARLQGALRQEGVGSRAGSLSPPRPSVSLDDEYAMVVDKAEKLQTEVLRLMETEEELQGELAGARHQIELYKRHVDERVQEAKKVCMEQWQEDRDALLTANNRLHEERMELRAILDAERERLSDVMSAQDLTKPELVRLRSELAQVTEELESNRRLLAKAQAEVSRTLAARNDMEADAASKIRAAEAELPRLRTAVSDAKSALVCEQTRAKELELALGRRDAEVAQLGAKVVELSEELQQFIANNAAANTASGPAADVRIAQLESEINVERGNQHKLKEQLREKTARVKQLEYEKGRFKEARDAAEADIQSLRASIDRKGDAIRRLTKDRADLELSVEHWKIQAVRLEEMVKAGLPGLVASAELRRGAAHASVAGGAQPSNGTNNNNAVISAEERLILPPHAYDDTYAKIVATSVKAPVPVSAQTTTASSGPVTGSSTQASLSASSSHDRRRSSDARSQGRAGRSVSPRVYPPSSSPPGSRRASMDAGANNTVASSYHHVVSRAGASDSLQGGDARHSIPSDATLSSPDVVRHVIPASASPVSPMKRIEVLSSTAASPIISPLLTSSVSLPLSESAELDARATAALAAIDEASVSSSLDLTTATASGTHRDRDRDRDVLSAFPARPVTLSNSGKQHASDGAMHRSASVDRQRGNGSNSAEDKTRLQRSVREKLRELRKEDVDSHVAVAVSPPHAPDVPLTSPRPREGVVVGAVVSGSAGGTTKALSHRQKSAEAKFVQRARAKAAAAGGASAGSSVANKS